MRRGFLLALLLVLISPLFGVYLSDLVGYREPLDLAAEMLGLQDHTERINWTPFLDYTVPGLPDWAGYVVSGIIGILIIFGLGMLMMRVKGE